MKIQLSDHFTYKKLFKFTLPSIGMMIFTAIYGVVDGFFISNFVGKTPFAAVNFAMPFLMILSAFGFMIASGGSALISKTLGQGQNKRANELYSMLIYITIAFGIVVTALGIVFIKPILQFLGAEGELLAYGVIYGRIILIALPFYALQQEFQVFFVTAEKPNLAFYVTLISGCANMVLDALFIVVFKWGVIGAAVATALAQTLGGVIPLIYFIKPNTSLLRISKPLFDGKALLKACTNGSSELLSFISTSIVGMLYNVQLMKYSGENGVAAYGVMMYVNMVFIAIFIGYSIGTSPLVGYHFGAQNHSELKSLLSKSNVIMIITSISMFLAGILLARPLGIIFVGYNDTVFELTVSGFKIFSFQFLFSGLAIFTSGFFTALNNGLISAIISFLRTLVFQIVAILVLPLIFDIDGIWLSVVAAELMAAILGIIFIVVNKKKYKY